MSPMLLIAAIAAGVLWVLLLTILHGVAGITFADGLLRHPYWPWAIATAATVPVLVSGHGNWKQFLVASAVLYFVILIWKILEGTVLRIELDLQSRRRGR